VKFVVDLKSVHPYRPGADAGVVRRRFGLEEVVKLASNEYPAPPVAGVREAITAVIDQLNRYPDTHSTVLRQALADHYATSRDCVAVGNGSLELLLLLGEGLLAPGVEAVFPAPSFALYRKMCSMHGATAVEVPLKDHRVDLASMAAAVTDKTSLVIICNPNNPTGTYVSAAAIAAFVADVPSDVLVVVDEAYNEFVTEADSQDTIDLVRRHDNVCVTRTFSKIYGLCGLRIGYALCSETVREAIDTLRQPFNVSLVAQVAATESLRHQDEIAGRKAANAELRSHLVGGLMALGLASLPSQANFVLTDMRGLDVPATEVCDRLTAQGAIVRDGAAFGLPGRARITIGTRSEIAFLLDKVAALAAGERRPRQGG
jgi:histidinol-phosphate aminotransferase